MNSPFKIQKASILPGSPTYVSWTRDVQKFVYSYILMDVVFAVIKCDEVGFGVYLNSGEVESLWITKDSWAQDKSKNYSHYLQEMYNVAGVLFHEHDKAIEFHEWLEKKYMWEKLSG